MKVRVENVYTNGHKSSCEFEPGGAEPDPTDAEAMEAWWEDWVWPETGDGTEAARTADGSCYTGRIVAAANPALVGLTREWVD